MYHGIKSGKVIHIVLVGNFIHGTAATAVPSMRVTAPPIVADNMQMLSLKQLRGQPSFMEGGMGGGGR